MSGTLAAAGGQWSDTFDTAGGLLDEMRSRAVGTSLYQMSRTTQQARMFDSRHIDLHISLPSKSVSSPVNSTVNVTLPAFAAERRAEAPLLLAISSAKISIYFSNKIHGSNFIKQLSESVMV